ncbi:hypothetical protein AWM68_13950 [Fictibacillus phosphorivorans]|uniref:SGNH/GDSL hydrolase family protein n=1 Tax=Fictibacillus phosphorivorans TaxID=1221500 RepID=A0A163PVN8_9BACL|nr:SGNH/GDSL hydrolase family protein [Fictibacillus phosphorivorans]KZE64202.1 hypothetical protein AWM68_13950 [Fictibacillus phosphorivorans]
MKEVVHFKNAPKDLSERYNQKKAAGEVFAFHLIGSTNTSQDEGTWAKVFTSEMKNIYKEDISIQTSSFAKYTSTELIKNKIYDDITAIKADVVLIEPPLLNDNEGISMKDTLYVLSNMIADIRTTNPESIILLQPSNPIFSPEKYANQIAELEQYAKDKNVSYLNHWTSWPSVDSEEIKDYYDSRTLMPNEKGHKLWADYMISLFK